MTSEASFCDVRSGGRAGVLVTRVLKARCNSSSSKPGLGVAGLIPATAAVLLAVVKAAVLSSVSDKSSSMVSSNLTPPRVAFLLSTTRSGI